MRCWIYYFVCVCVVERNQSAVVVVSAAVLVPIRLRTIRHLDRDYHPHIINQAPLAVQELVEVE